MKFVTRGRRVPQLRHIAALAGGGALGLVMAASPAQAQSLGDAITADFATICAGTVGADLASVCAIGGANASIGNTGSSATSSSQGGQVPESATMEHLEKKRKEAQNASLYGAGQTGMSGAPDEMSFSLGGLSGFLTLDYERGDKNTTTLDPGFNSNKYGVTVGVDRHFGPVIAGIAFNYGRTSADITGGGNFDIDSYGGLVYASFTPVESAFIDLSAGYSYKDYSLTRTVSFTNTGGSVTGTANGNPNGDEYRFGASGGYDFHHENLTFGPRVGLNYSNNSVDAFSESGTTGLELRFASHDTESLTSSIGFQGSAAISTSFGVLVPQVSAEYIHEFSNGQQTLSASLVQDLANNQLTFQTDTPDRNYYGVGVGLVAVLPQGLSTFASYHGIVGDSLRSSHAFTVGLRKEF